MNEGEGPHPHDVMSFPVVVRAARDGRHEVNIETSRDWTMARLRTSSRHVLDKAEVIVG